MATAEEKAAAAAAKAAAKAAAENAPAAGMKLNGDPLPDPIPASVTLGGQYGFYDDDESFKIWQEGQIVTDADEILTLLMRDAPLAPASE